MKRFSHVVSCLLTAIPLALSLLNGNLLYAQDAKGCKDSPYLTRFPGSSIDMCNGKDDDTENFILGPGKTKAIEGKTSEITYLLPSSASSAQVARNLNTALQKAAWTSVWMDGWLRRHQHLAQE
jgi:hypothetical protein